MRKKTEVDAERVARSRYWREGDARMVVESWRSSGESATAFARRLGIHRHRLDRWARRLALSREMKFHPVQLVADGPVKTNDHGAPHVIEVQLPTGHRVRLPHGFEPDDFRQVLAVLHEVAPC